MIYVALLYVLCFVVSLYVFQICSGFKLKSCIYRNGLFLFILMVVIIAFCYQPLITDDLYRYHLLIDKMRNKSFEWILFSSPYIHEPLSNLIFFTVSKVTPNNNIYQVIGVVFIYGIFFLNLRKITAFNISKEENLYIVTFLSYIILLFSISGTRNTMAAMLFSFALLREKENKYSWIFYLFSVCTHISMLPIVIIRILCFFLPKKRINFIHILLLFWAFLIKFILKNLYNIHNIYISTIVSA